MIFDAHCDVLYKMGLDPTIHFQDSKKLQLHYDVFEKHAKVQVFAMWVPPNIPENKKYDFVLHMISIFHEKILAPNPRLRFITSQEQIFQLKDEEIGCILALEGCDCIHTLDDMDKLLHMGVSSVGLTWNHANKVADGVHTDGKRGLTPFGREVVQLLNETNSWCDLAHLHENAFWQVIEFAKYPIVTHANSYEVCAHPRNLKNDQMQALVKRNGFLGITFVPEFLNSTKKAGRSDVIRHLNYFKDRGLLNSIGFGSDFDGVIDPTEGLEYYSDFADLRNEISQILEPDEIQQLFFDNLVSRYPVREMKIK